MPWQPDPLDISVLNLALDEDLGSPWCDVTTELLFPLATNTQRHQAKIVSKHPEPIAICGIEWLRLLFTRLSSHCDIQSSYIDGQQLVPGAELLTITGDAQTLLKGERTALNYLRHLCAIATLTARYVDRVKDSSLKILDTRKTSPGLRRLEKYAVHCGGGVNHRMGLYDAIMVKDTHVDMSGGMKRVMEVLPRLNPQSLPVIIEVRTRQELDEVFALGQKKVNRVLLDNMPLLTMQHCAADCRGIFETEASGNITLNTIAAVAATGVDYASIGELTYGAGQVDLSMRGYQNYSMS
ncbi:MAG TPA: carboxylating nicotinate-nucleotide diphosphorylase [Gammaproteobacteria bacterium]|nr:carboxylating nicotinate-nucleotide diphosphorylase [Gammaproteobacteria bacterium]